MLVIACGRTTTASLAQIADSSKSPNPADLLGPLLYEPQQRDGVNDHDQEIRDDDWVPKIADRAGAQRFVNDLKTKKKDAHGIKSARLDQRVQAKEHNGEVEGGKNPCP